MFKMDYLTALKVIEETEKKLAEDEKWLPRLYSEKMIAQTKIGIELNKKTIESLRARLPQLKEEYKKTEIARLTAEIERIKNL